MLGLCVGEYRGNSIKGFLIFLKARIELETEQYLFRVYVSDAIAKGINAFGQYGGAKDALIDNRYIDLLHLKHKNTKPIEASDVINGIIAKAHLEVSD